MSTLTSMQNSAVESIKSWYEGPDQEYYLAGYAGTGKSFLIKPTIETLGIEIINVAFATFTGKASLVVTRKAEGEYYCMTLHKLLYEASIDKYTGKVTFIPREKEDYQDIKLIVIDEASMVPPDLLAQLRTLEIKTLFVGDHGQLPPVMKKGEVAEVYTRLQNADFTLTEIHRQAEGNPIIFISKEIREGKKLITGGYRGKDGEGAVYIATKGELPKFHKSMLNASQVLCGRNATRHMLNSKIRELKGITSSTPVEGDKLVCLRNNWSRSIDDVPLVNGMIGFIASRPKYNSHKGKDYYSFKFRPDFSTETSKLNGFADEIIKGLELPYSQIPKDLFREVDRFNYGYAITTHKSQGSEWENVVVYNEILGGANAPGYNKSWLYTAVTRTSMNSIILL